VEGNEAATYEMMKGKVMEELKNHFKPEFLNRVDDTIVFPQLSKEEIHQIVGLFVKSLRDRLLDRGIDIEVSDAARQHLAEKGYDPTLGARPLRRAVQQLVEDPLSEKILNAELITGDVVKVGFSETELTFD